MWSFYEKSVIIVAMPKIIRRALYQKVAQIDDLRQFRDDFALATGLTVDFVDELDQCPQGLTPMSPLCQVIQGSESGRQFCGRTQQQLLAAAADQPACLTCDAGLHEAAVPVRVGGVVVGYLRFHGIASRQPDAAGLHRIVHLLRKADVHAEEAQLRAGFGRTPTVSPPLLQAYLRLLGMAAQQLAQRMTAYLVNPAASMPRVVEQACRAVRRRALAENIRLPDIARECGVSPSHLSRVFHHATGLTFREYVARWRAEHALNLLDGRESITRIAFDAGFQSLSQFNRVFRAVHGKSPRQVRAERRRMRTQA